MKQEFPAVRIMESGNSNYAPLWREVCTAAAVKKGDLLNVSVEDGVIILAPSGGLEALLARFKQGGEPEDGA